MSSFRILGPFEAVSDDGRSVELRTKPRALLAALLLTGTAMSAETLVDAIWGETAPPSARDLIRLYVSQLRESLGGSVIETHPGGYAVAAGTVTDATEFIAALEDARAERARGNPDLALDAYDRGLALWATETALPDTALEGDARIAVQLLEEARLAALEERFEVALNIRPAHELIAALDRLVSVHPARERLRGLLMVALYRSGRQADALATYRYGRQYLFDEYGLEPSQELRDLERAILQQDRSLDLPRTSNPRTSSSQRGRRLLLLTVILATAAGAAALVAVWADTGRPGVVVHADSIVALDPLNGRLAKTFAISGAPVAAGVGGGVLNIGTDAHTLLQFDPRNDRLIATVGLPKEPRAVTYADGSVWVSYEEDGTLTRIGPGRLLSPPAPPEPEAKGPLSLAAATDGLWVGSADNAVTHLSAEGGATMSLRAIQPHALTVAFGSLWVAQATRVTVRRIDGQTGRTIALIPVGGPTSGIAATASAIWTLAWAGSTLWRIDPRTNAVVAAIPVSPDASAVATARGTVWVVANAPGTLQEIDPSTNQVSRTIQLKRPISAVTGSRRLLWLGVR